jgi:hypothetical protein
MLTSTDSDNIGLPSYPATTVEGLEVNTLWDGLFHGSTAPKIRKLGSNRS